MTLYFYNAIIELTEVPYNEKMEDYSSDRQHGAGYGSLDRQQDDAKPTRNALLGQFQGRKRECFRPSFYCLILLIVLTFKICYNLDN